MINIPKPGKSKQELLDKLEIFKNEYSSKINENEIILTKITDGYRIKAQKQVLFMTFHVNADIIAKDNEYIITWESNAPESKVNEALEKVKEMLSKD